MDVSFMQNLIGKWRETMTKTEPAGFGAAWVREGEYGKYFSLVIETTFNGHPIEIVGSMFKNTKKKKEKQPDYKIKINDCRPAKPREFKRQETKEELPF